VRPNASIQAQPVMGAGDPQWKNAAKLDETGTTLARVSSTRLCADRCRLAPRRPRWLDVKRPVEDLWPDERP